MRRQNGAKRAPAALGVAAVLTALSLLASACSRGSVSPSQTPDTVSGHLIWWDIAQQADSKAVAQELIDRFHTINPNVTVDLVELGFDDLKAKFDTAAQSASGAPDVITLDSSWVADFGARGYLARLDGTRAEHISTEGTGGGASIMDFPHDAHRDLIADFLDAVRPAGEVRQRGRDPLRDDLEPAGALVVVEGGAVAGIEDHVFDAHALEPIVSGQLVDGHVTLHALLLALWGPAGSDRAEV